MTAAIAQGLLSTEATNGLTNLLPESNGQMGQVASWADQVARSKFPWSPVSKSIQHEGTGVNKSHNFQSAVSFLFSPLTLSRRRYLTFSLYSHCTLSTLLIGCVTMIASVIVRMSVAIQVFVSIKRFKIFRLNWSRMMHHYRSMWQSSLSFTSSVISINHSTSVSHPILAATPSLAHLRENLAASFMVFGQYNSTQIDTKSLKYPPMEQPLLTRSLLFLCLPRFPRDYNIIEKRQSSDFDNNNATYLHYFMNRLSTGDWNTQIPAWQSCPSDDPSPINACSQTWAKESIELACSHAYVDQNGKNYQPGQ